MKYSDFYHIHVEGDGSCFFHSITGIIHLNEKMVLFNSKPITYKIENRKWPLKSSDLRKRCVKWLRANLDYHIKGINLTIKDEILNEIESNEDIKKKTIEGYFKYMEGKDSYAGQIEIWAICNLLNKNIRTYIFNDNRLSDVGLGYNIKRRNLQDDIFLYHNLGDIGNRKGGHHFEILFPKKKATIISKVLYNESRGKHRTTIPLERKKTKKRKRVLRRRPKVTKRKRRKK